MTKKPLSHLQKISTLVLLIHFLFTTQILEQIFMVFTCRTPELIGNKTLKTVEIWQEFLQPTNFYDSQIQCITQAPGKMTILVILSLFFVAGWIIAMPIVVFWKTDAKYKIDLSVQVLKVLLVIVNKLVGREETRGIIVTIIMSLFILFLAYE